MYQKRKKEKCFTATRQHRYGSFVTKLNAEIELRESRKNFLNVLYALREQKETEYWNKTISILAEMKKELTELGKIPGYHKPVEVIKYAVSIFDIASRYQDILNGKILCAPNEKAAALENFNNSLAFCGRHETYDLRHDSQYGHVPYWNTTKVGEAITLDNIYFGPDVALPKKSAANWIKLPKKKRMYITEQTTYKYGKISKEIVVWQTEGIVKLGIYQFCKIAMEHFNDSLSILLDGEE